MVDHVDCKWCLSFQHGLDGLPVMFTAVDDAVMGGVSQSQLVYDAEQVPDVPSCSTLLTVHTSGVRCV